MQNMYKITIECLVVSDLPVSTALDLQTLATLTRNPSTTITKVEKVGDESGMFREPVVEWEGDTLTEEDAPNALAV